MSEQQTVDRKDLKIQALLEKISSLTTNYENQVADLRVGYTLLEARVEELEKELELRNSPEDEKVTEDDGTE